MEIGSSSSSSTPSTGCGRPPAGAARAGRGCWCLRVALGLARRARGVVYRDRLFLVLEHAFDGLRRALGEVILVGVAALARVGSAHGLDVPRGEEVFQLGVNEDQLRPGVLDYVLDLVLAKTGVYGDEDEA